MADYTTKDGRPSQYGATVQKDSVPLAAVAVRGGVALAVNSSGYGITAGIAAGDAPVGISEKAVDNSAGSAGDQSVNAQRDFFYDNDSTNPITQAMLHRSYCYLVDNHTAGSSNVGGTLALLGVPVYLGTGADAGKVAVRVMACTPHAALPAQAAAFKARGVALNLEAGAFAAGVFTATANGALATQDGLTVDVNDVLMLPAGTLTTLVVSAANSGPYVVTSIGGASSKVVLTRPLWWKHGDEIPAGQEIPIKAGTLFGGSTFKAICDEGLVIGTGDPGLWAGMVSTQVTFVSGESGTISTIPIRSAAKSQIAITNSGTAAHASTRTWRPTTLTAGALGTAALVVSAESAPGTTNTSDVGVYTISVINWI